MLARHSELDGDHYGLLTPAADALEQRYPLAATLMLRAMIDFSLERARHSRYGHAARHLQTCEYMARLINDFGDHGDHDPTLRNSGSVMAGRAGFGMPDFGATLKTKHCCRQPGSRR